MRRPQYSRPVNRDRTDRLHQGLSRRAFSRSEPASRGTSRTVRTEVRVERRGIALVVADAGRGPTRVRLAEISGLGSQQNRHGFVLVEVEFSRSSLSRVNHRDLPQQEFTTNEIRNKLSPANNVASRAGEPNQIRRWILEYFRSALAGSAFRFQLEPGFENFRMRDIP